MSLGSMRDLVTIEQLTETADAILGQTSSWKELETVPGEVRPLAGRELYQAQAVQPFLSHRVTIRYLEALSAAKHRLRWKSRANEVLEIKAAPNVDARRRFQVIDCIQRVSSSS